MNKLQPDQSCDLSIGWKPLTIITKYSILDVEAVVDPPLLLLITLHLLFTVFKSSQFKN